MTEQHVYEIELGPRYFDDYYAAEAEVVLAGGVIWRHDTGYYAVTVSHSDADELPEPNKWTEAPRSQ
jgi:hypothetical protein